MGERFGESERALGVGADVAVKAAFFVGFNLSYFALFHGRDHGAMIGAQKTK
ncbi:MAG: hypothetical protein QGF09_15720 [Rhodospirillales bacterium]|nr:hypothetical protein [Rhodospirillales bacterium]